MELQKRPAPEQSIVGNQPFQRLDLSQKWPYPFNWYARRAIWEVVQGTLIRYSPRRAYSWRRFWLRCFGAKMGTNAATRHTTKVMHPWQLTIGANSLVAEDVMIYNLGPITIGSQTVISQHAYLCAGTHDYTKPDFPLVRPPIVIGNGVWIASHVFIGPGVTVGDNAIIGACAVVFKDVPSNMIAVGNPAQVIKQRKMDVRTPDSVSGSSPASTSLSASLGVSFPSASVAEWKSNATDSPSSSSDLSSAGQAMATDNSAPAFSALGIVDVMIPTLNEAHHIREVVANARQMGQVYVLDSGSIDGTQELARQAGAVVVEHPFEGYARQKNWGLDHLPLTGQWVLILDADERLSPELAVELQQVTTSPDSAQGYYLNRLLILMGKSVRFGGLFPSWQLRFFRRGACRYEERAVHEHMVCSGRTRYARHLLLHYRNETWTEYIKKHVRYADLESDEWVRKRMGAGTEAQPYQLFPRLLGLRLKLRRDMWPMIPARPMVRFVWMYILRLGFMDGRMGWDLAWLMAYYEYMISLLYRQKRKTARAARKASSSE